MERYEVRVKYDEIKQLADSGNFQSAMEIADTVDWDRVKNISMLCKVGEIYERCRYYEDSKAIYERAYHIQPQSRNTVYRLANVSAKLKHFQDAEEYLAEYKEIVPYDPNIYALTYKIRKGQGADISELISILEQLNSKEYIEKWAYELAVLYGESEQLEKCAKECDNIFLWFGEGKYVRKALKLKSLFRNLTAEQERYLNSGKPVDANKTMRNAQEAMKVSEEKEREFIRLQEEIVQFDEPTSDYAQKVRDMESLRNEAIDASREAKAAELLNEAYEEKQMEDEMAIANDVHDMIGATEFPTFNIPIMDVLTPVTKPEYTRAKQEIIKEIVPGTEFIDMSAEQSEPAVERDAKVDPIEEARARIRNLAKESESDISLIGYEIKDEPEADIQEESIEEAVGQYSDMGELLLHADEMNADDLAQSLAMILTGKTAREEEKELVEENEAPAKKMQGVINLIWSKSPSKRSAKTYDDYHEEPDVDNIEIKDEVTTNKFDTLNLQKELADSIGHILNATETEEIDKTIAIMDRRMLKNNISQYAASTTPKEEESTDVETEELIAAFDDVISEETRRKIEEQEMYDNLEQEQDGQIKLSIEETDIEDMTIPGQINMEDYFAEREKNQLEEAKVRAIIKAGEYMEQVSLAAPVIAEEEARMYLANSQLEILEQAKSLMESSEPNSEEIDSVIKSLTMMLAIANEKTADINGQEIGLTVLNDYVEEADSLEQLETEEEVEISEELTAEVAATDEIENESQAPEESEEVVEEIEDSVESELPIIELNEADIQLSDEAIEAMKETKEEFMDSIAEITPKEISDVDVKKAESQIVPISDEQMDVMDYFLNVPEMETQIVEFIENQNNEFANLVISGKTGSGRASLALRLYKAIRINNPQLPNKTMKLDADVLNKKSVIKVYEKIGSGVVLIEHAGLLNNTALCELKEAMRLYNGKIYTIIIGNTSRIKKLLKKHEDIAAMCNYKFEIPEYTQDQYVDFAKNYAYSYGYVFDEMALLAVYSELSAIKTKNKLITLQDVKNIINDAMIANEKRTKKLFAGLFGKNKDKDGNIILKEKDFQL